MPSTQQNSDFSAHAIRVADLAQDRAHAFDIVPGAAEIEALREMLQIDALRKLRFRGTLSPLGKHDWRLHADLGATVVQPCVATLAPVTTRIDVAVERSFVREFETSDEAEVEMPEDDTADASEAETTDEDTE